MTSKQRQKKVRRVMREFKAGTLKSSSGQPVKSRQQAIAIAMSEAGMSRGDKSETYWDAYILQIEQEEEDPEEESEMDKKSGKQPC
jgi:hypothetical protein